MGMVLQYIYYMYSSCLFVQVSIQLMDWDALGANDYAGCMFLNLGGCPIDMDQDNVPRPATPTWMPFFLEKPGDSSGELLVSYQVYICKYIMR